MTPEFEILRDEIEKRHARGEGWTKIAKSFDHERITRGHIYKMVIGGWEPDDPELRLILGLPAYKPMPVCPLHGVVHDYDCTTQVVKPLPKPRQYKTLFDTPVKVLAWQLENRKEMIQ